MANVGTSKPSSSKRFFTKTFSLKRLPALCRGGGGAVAAPSTPTPSIKNNSTRVLQGEFLEVFRHFDADRDGKISGEELRAFFTSFGEEMSAEAAEGVITDLDSDGDGLLDFGDFLVLMEREEGQDEDLKKAFEMFEAVKGSGTITPRGLQRVLNRLGDKRTYEECEAMIRAYDIDGNGELSFHEFHRMMMT